MDVQGVHGRRGLRAVAALLVTLAAFAVAAGSAAAAAPPNDAFASAETITGDAGSVSGSNAEATGEAGEPSHGGPSGASVWYRWVSPFTGHVAFETCGGFSFDTLLAAYTGEAVAALQQLAVNDDACDVGSRIVFAATEGTTYRIAVDGYEAATGGFTLRWGRAAAPPPPPPPPALDSFASARGISGVRGRTMATTLGATAEPGEPSLLNATSVWFRWRAPRSLPIVFNTCGAAFDSLLGVWRGSAVDGLRRLVFNDDACGLGSRVTFTARAGVVYQIGVGGLGDTGPFTLSWAPKPCVVPNLRGTLLAQARQRIARAGCAVGAVRRVSSLLVPRNGVVAQWPPAGTRLAYLGRVNLAVSTGRR